MFDLGDVVPLSVQIRNAAGTAENATSVSLTITLPDGTTTNPGLANPSAGRYVANYTPPQPGRYLARWLATGTNASAYTDTFTVIGPGDLALVSLNELKAHLNIAGASSDEELRVTLLAATSAAEDNLNRPLSRTTKTRTIMSLPGNGQALVLDADLASITSIIEDGVTLTGDDWLADLDAGVIWREPRGSRQWATPVTVTWTTAGFTNPSIRQAVLELARHLWKTQRGTMPMMPRDAEGYAPSASDAYSLPNRVVELLDPWRLP